MTDTVAETVAEPGRILPRYPIYIPSKGRYEKCLTARFLARENVPFKLVVEPQEEEKYAETFARENILVLPFRDLGSVIPARNWMKDHATAEGHERHWQLDDNIQFIYRWYKGHRLHCPAAPALRAVEDFTDRYENIAISGMNYGMFGVTQAPPFQVNARVYSASLISNALPNRWRGKYNEDTDMCLQVLADGWCTVLVNVFLVHKIWTMVVKGGNTDEIYKGDGRLKMARALERLWPGVVKVRRRFQRPQHVVDWSKFTTPLKLKEGIDLEELAATPDEYGMKLVVTGEVKREDLRRIMPEGADGVVVEPDPAVPVNQPRTSNRVEPRE